MTEKKLASLGFHDKIAKFKSIFKYWDNYFVIIQKILQLQELVLFINNKDLNI